MTYKIVFDSPDSVSVELVEIHGNIVGKRPHKRVNINIRLILSAYLYFLLTQFQSDNIIPLAAWKVSLLDGNMLKGGIPSYQHFNPL